MAVWKLSSRKLPCGEEESNLVQVTFMEEHGYVMMNGGVWLGDGHGGCGCAMMNGGVWLGDGAWRVWLCDGEWWGVAM